MKYKFPIQYRPTHATWRYSMVALAEIYHWSDRKLLSIEGLTYKPCVFRGGIETAITFYAIAEPNMNACMSGILSAMRMKDR